VPGAVFEDHPVKPDFQKRLLFFRNMSLFQNLAGQAKGLMKQALKSKAAVPKIQFWNSLISVFTNMPDRQRKGGYTLYNDESRAPSIPHH
jgi:hypothetical protein